MVVLMVLFWAAPVSHSTLAITIAIFYKYFQVSTIPKYWSWLYNSILPAMEPPYWYGPYGLDDIEALSKTMASKSRARAKSKTSKTKSSGSAGSDDLDVAYHRYPKRYIADRAVSYVVGLARARQLRNTPQGGS